MWHPDVVAHAKLFADNLGSNVPTIHGVLRKYQSKEVVDDEVRRSLEALRGLSEIRQYFETAPLSQRTATFLPLNLPLYSFVLFAAMPAYQSASLVIRAPQRMRGLFNELFEVLVFGEHYPNITLFDGSREKFLSDHCKTASVVLFAGKYENFLRIRKACSKDTLILYNGVGHNPLVVTPSADINLAVEKTLQVKLFNNGQDCAGPDTILVHGSVIDIYLERLLAKLAHVRCGSSYTDDDVVVGPLFEVSSLLDAVNLISALRRRGAVISSGGHIDLNHNIMYPCVVRASLRQLQNFTELYSPLFLVTEYEHDRELALYFSDPHAGYHEKEMYISLFGESDYVTGVHGSIVLKDHTILDVERGTEEFGGYGPGASSVSYRGLRIPKPLLVPREIYNFLSNRGRQVFVSVPTIKGNWEQQIIATQFQETVQHIFGDQLVFAYIFGSFATETGRRYADVDTFVCVHNRQTEHIEQYLDWVFSMHEMFGRIPDFKYPAEIVPFADLQAAVTRLPTLELSAGKNEAAKYDAMVWCHSLSQPWIGTVHPENVPEHWKQLFPAHASRILRSFLGDLEKTVAAGSDISKLRPEVHEIPRQEPGVSHFIENLNSRGPVNVLKMVPFEEHPVYPDIVLRLVARREFMGRSAFSTENPEHLHHPCFRFGVVALPPAGS